MFSKLKITLALFILMLVSISTSFAQEHYTINNVRVVSFYRTEPGQFDNYMKYLRTNFLPQQEEAKKQGLILDYYILINEPTSSEDWDVAIANVFKSFGNALDFDQSKEDKIDEIAAKHFKTKDQDQIKDKISTRFEMRKFMGTKYFRGVTLKSIN
jgi:hypothetical protein